MAKLVLLGGTFDPPHNGHMALAKVAADYLEADRVVFMPTGNPNFKQGQDVAPARQRLHMVELACEEDLRFVCSDREVRRKGVTHTSDTLRQLKESYPEDQIFFVVGGDSAAHIMKWYEAEVIARLCTVVAVARVGYDFQVAKEAHEKCGLGFRVMFLEADVPDVSSTEVRQLVALGKDITGLVPPQVADYIAKEGLYK